MARAFDIEPLDATFGAIVTGMKLAELDEAGWRDLKAAWLDYALLVFPDQHLKRDQQIAFAKPFRPARVRDGRDQQRAIRWHPACRDKTTTTS